MSTYAMEKVKVTKAWMNVMNILAVKDNYGRTYGVLSADNDLIEMHDTTIEEALLGNSSDMGWVKLKAYRNGTTYIAQLSDIVNSYRKEPT